MKDLLDREILAGDTLAYYRPDYVSHIHPFGGELRLAKVINVAPFAIQLQAIVADNKPAETWVITDASKNYAICQ